MDIGGYWWIFIALGGEGCSRQGRPSKSRFGRLSDLIGQTLKYLYHSENFLARVRGGTFGGDFRGGRFE